jgi:IMP dehydrogenase/GMP reductase
VVKFDFDDIIIVPKVHTTITSRYKDIILPETLPLFTAPMDTVVDLDNMDSFIANNINTCLPRTIKYQDFIHRMIIKGLYSSAKWIHDDNYQKVFISMGFEELSKHLSTKLYAICFNGHILIDVANGHMEKVMDYAKDIKLFRPDITIMVGNIANPDTYWWYAGSDCIDYIRVGIGNGGGCLTTKQSGVGHPMASLIKEVYEVKQQFIKYNSPDKFDPSLLRVTPEEKVKPVKVIPAIVADGGMKDYSDIIKALALGADYVMIGSIFNKSIESCADNYVYGIKVGKKLANRLFDNGYPVKKHFRGMSTKGAQKAMGKTRFKTSEGVVRYRKVEYHLKGWVENFEHYLRNAMIYADAKTLNDFIGKADICQITKNAYDRFNK